VHGGHQTFFDAEAFLQEDVHQSGARQFVVQEALEMM
jgi:hypothetical protein